MKENIQKHMNSNNEEYQIAITLTLCKVVSQSASSAEEAYNKVVRDYENSDIHFNRDDDAVSLDFEVL